MAAGRVFTNTVSICDASQLYSTYISCLSTSPSLGHSQTEFRWSGQIVADVESLCVRVECVHERVHICMYVCRKRPDQAGFRVCRHAPERKVTDKQTRLLLFVFATIVPATHTHERRRRNICTELRYSRSHVLEQSAKLSAVQNQHK